MSAERQNGELEILGEIVIYQSPCGKVTTKITYVRGHHPELGVLTTKGWTGNETIIVKTVVSPVYTYEIKPSEQTQ